MPAMFERHHTGQHRRRLIRGNGRNGSAALIEHAKATEQVLGGVAADGDTG